MTLTKLFNYQNIVICDDIRNKNSALEASFVTIFEAKTNPTISELDKKTREPHTSENDQLPNHDDSEYSGVQRLPSLCYYSGHQPLSPHHW